MLGKTPTYTLLLTLAENKKLMIINFVLVGIFQIYMFQKNKIIAEHEKFNQV